MMLGLAPPRIGTEGVFAAALGISVAVLLVGTSFLLRWQRNRQRFDLMRLALENGATQFPEGPPYWLLSLREAVSTLALGIGLLAAGAVSYGIGVHTPEPTAEEWKAATTDAMRSNALEGRRPGPMRPQGRPEDDGPPEDRGPGRPMPPNPAQPPIPNPVFEKHHRAQSMQTIGLLAMACGGVLVILGLARTGFARVERNHAGKE